MAEVAPRSATNAANLHANKDKSVHPPPPPPPAAAPTTKKGKSKKAANDPNEAARQLQAKIAQLEQDKQGRSEEDAEIEREVRKANREMHNIMARMDSAKDMAEHVQREWHKLLTDMKRTEREHAKAKKRADQLQKEKDAQRSELNKANSMKEKLEKLSRELTKDNKKLKEDLREAKDTAADTNDELHQRLEQMVDDMEEVIASRESPHHTLADFSSDKSYEEHFKLRSLIEQYEMREIHMASVLRTRELEIQYHIAQHERLKKAQDAELSKSHQLTRQVSTFSQTENELRSQLNIYVEKFKQVEDTLNNSNDLFLTFRKEMEEMSKKTKRLEKENMQLTRKQEATNKNIFQMAEERSHTQKEIDRLSRENDKLKKLCRAMQTNGYGRAPAGQPQSHGHAEGDDDLGETDSEYDEYEEDDDDGEEYDDDTEDEQEPPLPRTFGPVPPPPSPPTTQAGAQQGTKKVVNGVNGVRH